MGVIEVTQEMLAAKFEVIFPHLDERQRRLLMGAADPGRPGATSADVFRCLEITLRALRESD